MHSLSNAIQLKREYEWTFYDQEKMHFMSYLGLTNSKHAEREKFKGGNLTKTNIACYKFWAIINSKKSDVLVVGNKEIEIWI